MWKAEVGQSKPQDKTKKVNEEDDDWDTSGEVVMLSEKEQRWSKGKDADVQVEMPLRDFATQIAQVELMVITVN